MTLREDLKLDLIDRLAFANALNGLNDNKADAGCSSLCVVL